jgi:hypothetical protein
MTDKQINAAIAEACGWTEIRDNVVGKAPGETANRVMFLPNYSTSLNMMYDAEQCLWRKDYYMRHDYVNELGKLLNPHNWQRMEASDMLDATARQRAEAFLKTLGKWKERE